MLKVPYHQISLAPSFQGAESWLELLLYVFQFLFFFSLNSRVHLKMDVSRWSHHRVAEEIGGLADMLGDKRGVYAQTMINEDINGSAFMQLKLDDLTELRFTYGHALNLASYIQSLLPQDAGTVRGRTGGSFALDAADAAALTRLEESTSAVLLQVRSDSATLMRIIRKIQKWFRKQDPQITNAQQAAELTNTQLDAINAVLDTDELQVLAGWNRSKMTSYFGPADTIPFSAGFYKVLLLPEATDEEILSILNANHLPSSTGGGTKRKNGVDDSTNNDVTMASGVTFGNTKVSRLIDQLKTM